MSHTQTFTLVKSKQKDPPPPTYGPDLAVRLICPECRDPNPNIVEEFGSGDLVCGNCGLVLGDRVVDTRSEWRTFANDEGDDPSRVGAAADPLLGGADQLDTVISFRDGGSGIARELQRAASRGQGSRSERTLQNAFRDISTWCDQFSLPKTISDIAKQLYKRADEEKLLRGKPLDAVIAACIFIACRQAHVPRSFKDICALTHVSKKMLGRCYKVLEMAFTQIGSGQGNGPESYCVRYCNHLDLPVNVAPVCRDIIIAAREHGIADNRSPLSIAGGAIYFATHLLGEKRTAKEISSVAGVTEGTIMGVYRMYYAAKEKLVKPALIESGRADLSRLPFESAK